MHRRAWAVAGAILGVVAVVVGALVLDGTSVPDQFQPPAETVSTLGPVSGAESTPLPAWTLQAFGRGRPVVLGDYRGAPLLVNFWATWCPPCVEEMPMLQHVAEQADGKMAFLGVNVQDDPQKAVAFIDDLGVTYDQASDPASEFFTEVRGFGMPTTLFVDASGTIRYRHTGIVDDNQLRDLLNVHLGVQL
ncbi:MAG: TlpA family protein disulfide reductase [Actinobacteria bacterium]|nr:TlpA family protein disulfide reductase [Actinomycetota bacterium]